MSKRIIIDASVAIKWVVPEAGTDAALALRAEYELSAPELIVPEIANILWKKFQRGELQSGEAEIAAELLEKSGIRLISMQNLLGKATSLAMFLSHPAYDCVYLAAAIEADIPFVTADTRLLRKLEQHQFNAAKCHELSAGMVL